jgi:hypothetical protein
MKTVLRLFLAALAGAAVVVAVSQVSPDKARRSDEILRKMRQIDLLNHILPVLLTKDQINRLLPAIERARSKVNTVQNEEANELIKFESKVDDAIAKGIQRELTPAKTLLIELNNNLTKFAFRRQLTGEENADMVLAVVKKELNAGQIKAMANSHDIAAFDPRVDVSKLTEDDKLKFFIKDVLLDPQAYDLLVKLAKSKDPS